jgi:ribosomal protein S10
MNIRYTETKLAPFLFYSCGTIAVALQHHEAKFYLLYLFKHHFDVTVELTDTPCRYPVAMNITDEDSHKQSIFVWDDLAPRVRWKSSGTFLQVALSMGVNETCGLNITFQSLKSDLVTYFPSRDACEIQSPVPLPGKDQRITYILRTPDVSSWEEAERDCAQRGAALFSPYTSRHLGQVLTVVDLDLANMTPPCRALAYSLWEAPATFIGLRRSKVNAGILLYMDCFTDVRFRFALTL